MFIFDVFSSSENCLVSKAVAEWAWESVGQEWSAVGVVKAASKKNKEILLILGWLIKYGPKEL